MDTDDNEFIRYLTSYLLEHKCDFIAMEVDEEELQKIIKTFLRTLP